MSSKTNKYLGYGAVFFLIFTLFWSLCMMLPAISKFVKANGSKEMMDVSPKINSEEVYAYMNTTTPEGRIELKTIYRFQDFVSPMAYGPFILITLFFFHRRFLPGKKRFWAIILVPIVMVICDYCENFSILSVIESYPKKTPISDWIGIFTRLKWAMGICSALMFITILWIGTLKKKLKKENEQSN